MQVRLVILASDGRGARNLEIGPVGLTLGLVALVAAISGVLWLGWKIGELTAQF
ncbi:MAG: hypothetical protein RL701_8123 [Pseudomonadota bacterium]|jgi:hypothetical protein